MIDDPTDPEVPMRYDALPPGPANLAAVHPGPDLDAAGYVEVEYVAHGSARRLEAPDPGADAVAAAWVDPAPVATRVLVRAPEPSAFSGTVVMEWLNVSSGADAAPDWTYLGEEIVRRGHAWVGVSAQQTGAVGGPSSVTGDTSPGLRGTDPERYGALLHPGDAYSYDLFTAIGHSIDAPGAPLAGHRVIRRIAVGESQSAFALTTYLCRIAPALGAGAHFDAYLLHSRGRAELGLGEPGRPHRLEEVRTGPPALLPDLGVPVIVVQTETDVVSPRFGFAEARQPDGPWLRTWEVAGTAHADLWQIGEFEEFLGCPEPVNRGQQAYVVRAALRWLETWTSPSAPGDPGAVPAARPLTLLDGALAGDGFGNSLGGVRTPVVEAPVQILTGVAAAEASVMCSLFGATRAIAAAELRERYGSAEGYLASYRRAVEEAIDAGFVLAEDRAAILAEARPDLIEAAD